MPEIRVMNKTDSTAVVDVSYSPLTGRLNVMTLDYEGQRKLGWTDEDLIKSGTILRPRQEVVLSVRTLDRPGGMHVRTHPADAPLRVKEWEFLDVKKIDSDTIALVPRGQGVYRGRRPQSVMPIPELTVEDWRARYEEGYRAGLADRLLGVRLRYSEAPELEDYARGYRRGVLGLPFRNWWETPNTRRSEVREVHVRGHQRRR